MSFHNRPVVVGTQSVAGSGLPVIRLWVTRFYRTTHYRITGHSTPATGRVSLRLWLWLWILLAAISAIPAVTRGQDVGAIDSKILTVSPDFADGAWVDAGQPIGLRLSRPLDLQNERLAIVVGRTDLSALFAITPLVARYSANTLPLPSGETEMVVYLVNPGKPWTEIGKFPIRVRTRGGFRKAELKPGLTLTTNGQIAPDHGGNSTSRPPYAGVTFNPALRSTLVRDNGTLELQSNFLAVTKQTQALRFAAKGSGAPKFDLSDYLVKTQRGPLNFGAGHLSYGSSKHLMSGIASRGLTAGVTIAKFAELSVAALNGTSIVGWDNPVGLKDDSHRIYGATLKVDALPKNPGAMLFDISLLSGSVLPLSGVNDGEVNDRERNRGAGFHLAGKLPGDRLTLDAGYTVSRFENPIDQTLSQGVSLVPVKPETKAARFADLSLAILRNAPLTKAIKTSLTATLRHERVDPLYRSLGAAVQANMLQNVLEMSGGLGPIAFQSSYARAEDNLDDLATALKTLTHVSSANASLPIGSLFNASKPTAWLPQLTWSLSRTRQFGKELPLNSDFTDTHVPDQVSTAQSADVQWAIGKWKGGYRYNLSSQDNRQVGRETSDLDNLAHNVAAGVSPNPKIDLGATFSFEGAKNIELSQKNNTRRVGANIDLRPTRDLSLATVFSRTWMRDNPRTSENDNDDLSVELSQNFRLVRSAAQRPSGRIFFRYQRQSMSTAAFIDAVRGDPASTRSWALNSGVSLNAF